MHTLRWAHVGSRYGVHLSGVTQHERLEDWELPDKGRSTRSPSDILDFNHQPFSFRQVDKLFHEEFLGTANSRGDEVLIQNATA